MDLIANCLRRNLEGKDLYSRYSWNACNTDRYLKERQGLAIHVPLNAMNSIHPLCVRSRSDDSLLFPAHILTTTTYYKLSSPLALPSTRAPPACVLDRRANAERRSPGARPGLICLQPDDPSTARTIQWGRMLEELSILHHVLGPSSIATSIP